MNTRFVLFSLAFAFVACGPLARAQQPVAPSQAERDLEHLQRELLIGSASQRAAAAMRLSALGQAAQSALTSLYASQYDLDPHVRMSSIQAIGSLSRAPVESTERLLPALLDPDEHVRYAAEWVIAKFCQHTIQDAQLSRMASALREALRIVGERKHHAGHRQTMQRKLLELQNRIDGKEKLVSELSEPINEAPQRDAPDSVAQVTQPQELSSWINEYEFGDLLEHLRIIESLAPAAQIEGELPAELHELRRAILQQSMLQAEQFATDYAIQRWGAISQQILQESFSQLPSHPLPAWTTSLLDALEPWRTEEVEKLLAILKSEDNSLMVRKRAARILSRSTLDREIVQNGLRDICLDPAADIQLRATCISGLSNLASISQTPQAVDQATQDLQTLLDDPNQHSRIFWHSARALTDLNANSRELANRILGELQRRGISDDELPDLFETFARLGPDGDAVVPFIERGLACAEELIRKSAADAVQPLGKAARAIAPELIAVVLDPDESIDIRQAAAAGLAAIGPETVAHFGQELCFGDQVLQQQGFAALIQLGPNAAPALEGCIEILEESHAEEVRTAAVLTIGSMGPQAYSAAPQLWRILNSDSSPNLCAASILALSQIGNWHPEAQMPPAPVSNAASVRAAHAYADFIAGESQGLTRLIRQLAEPENEFATKALIDMGEPAAESLFDVMHDPRATQLEQKRAIVTYFAIPRTSYAFSSDLLQDEIVGDDYQTALMQLGQRKHLPLAVDLIQALSAKHNATTRKRTAEILNQWSRAAGSGFSEDRTDESYSRWGSQLGSALIRAEEEPATQSIPAPKIASQAFPRIPRVFSPRNSLQPQASRILVPAESAAPEIANAMAVPGSALTDDDSDDAGDVLTAPQQLSALSQPPGKAEVTVFYGTNRAQVDSSNLPTRRTRQTLYIALLCGSGLCVVCVWLMAYLRRKIALTVVSICMVGILSTGWYGWHQFGEHADLSDGPKQIQYGGLNRHRVAYGKCNVTIPSHHRTGELEAPSLFRLELRRDPEKHIFLQTTSELARDDFFADLQASLDAAGDDLLVFIHGYNVSFEEAALRTAQLAYDLDLEGAPVFYSWPSQDNWHEYQLDRKQIELSVDHIKQFLLQLTERSGAQRIHLIAHSMGNVGLTQALADIPDDPDKPKFNQVVLAAPDIDADIFKRRIAPKILGKAERCTMYTSKNDLALVASQYFNAGVRIGQTTLTEDPGPGLDIIDASAVDTSLLGHSYYGNVGLINDIRELLRNEPLAQRSYVRMLRRNERDLWFLDARGQASEAQAATSVKLDSLDSAMR